MKNYFTFPLSISIILKIHFEDNITKQIYLFAKKFQIFKTNNKR